MIEFGFSVGLLGGIELIGIFHAPNSKVSWEPAQERWIIPEELGKAHESTICNPRPARPRSALHEKSLSIFNPFVEGFAVMEFKRPDIQFVVSQYESSGIESSRIVLHTGILLPMVAGSHLIMAGTSFYE